MFAKILHKINYLSYREYDYLLLLQKHRSLDMDFYQSQNKKSLYAKLMPYLHYVKKGQYKDKYPFEDYSSGRYINSLYLAGNDILSPHHAYLKYGEIKEDDVIALRKSSPYGQKQHLIQMKYDEAFHQLSKPTQASQIAIVLHIYYDEVVSEIMDNIKELRAEADLFVSYCDHICGNKEQQLLAHIAQYYPQAIIIKIPNHGRDIFPFTQWLRKGFLDGYKAVLKLHSKRSKHNIKGDYYRQALVSAITPPQLSLDEIESLLNNESWGLLIHEDFLIDSPRYWYDNYYLTKNLLTKYNIDINAHEFILAAGCIYWLSEAVVQKLSQIFYDAYDFELEDGQKDGTMAHAIERVVTYIAKEFKLEIITRSIK